MGRRLFVLSGAAAPADPRFLLTGFGSIGISSLASSCLASLVAAHPRC